MLQSMRRLAASWVAKFLLIVLVGSFAIWGIGDIFRTSGRQNVATVGDVKVTVEQFRQLYNQRLQTLSRQNGRAITPDQARARGIDTELVSELVAEGALDTRARQLGLGIGDAEVLRRIQENRNFQTANGQFSRGLLEQVLRSNGLTEAGFIDLERRLAKRQQIARTVSGGAPLPAVAVDLINRYQNETRAIETMVLPREKAGEVPAPAPEALASYFEARKAAFRAPEYRKVAVLALTPEGLAPWIDVPQAEIAAFYEANKSSFGAPERRVLKQVLFPTLDEASAAASKIQSGATLDAIAAERGVSAKDLELGAVSRDALLDPAIAAAAFELAEGAVSAPVKGQFGVALLQVVKILPASLRSLDEASPAIRARLSVERARRDILDKHDKIEDGRAAGQTLTEIGQALGLPVEVFDAVDRSGRDPDGAPVADFLGRDDVIRLAFQTQMGVENDPVQPVPSAYVWYEVQGITKARERTFEEARARIEARWRDDQVGERLKEKADTILARLKGGETLSAIATAEGLTVAVYDAVKRGAGAEGLTDAAVNTVFSTAAGGAFRETGEDGVQQIIVRVDSATVPPPSTVDDPNSLLTELRNSVENDLLAQYIRRLQTDLGARIDTQLMRSVVGGDPG